MNKYRAAKNEAIATRGVRCILAGSIAAFAVLSFGGSSANAALVAYYDFNDGSGTTLTDLSANHLDGTLNGNLSTQWVAGNEGTSLNFNGNTANYVSVAIAAGSPLIIGSNTTAGAHSFTIGAWVYETGLGYGEIYCFGPNNQRRLFLQTGNSAGEVAYSWSDSNAAFRMTTSQVIAQNAWHYVTVSYDSSVSTNNYKFYYDGVLKNTQSVGSTQSLGIAAGQLLDIGKSTTNIQPWNGLIDNFIILNNAADQTQVTNLMAGTDANQIITWSGAGANTNWSTVGNWATAVATAKRAISFDTNNTASNNDFAANTQFAGITFNSTSGNFTITGNAVNLTGNVVNNSTNTQTISLNALVLDGGTRTFNAAAGNITVSSPIHQAAGQINGIVKIGSGTLTLSATGASDYDYTGATTVSNGKLQLLGAKLSGSALTVSGVSSSLSGNGTITQAALFQSSARLAPGSNPSTVGQFDFQGGLTLDSAALDVKLGAPNAISNIASGSDVINVTGNMTLNGSTTLNVSLLAGFTYGDYDFLNFSGILLGSGSILAPTNTAQYGYRIITNPNDLLLHVYLPPSAKTWLGQVAGSNNANWDILTTSNWQSGASATTYNESVDGNDPIIFNDTANGTTAIVLNTTVAPFSVTFANNVKSYSVGGSGSISGTASFTVSGGGGVALNTANTFTGDTVVSAGTLMLGHTNALAGSTLNYNNSGGTISFGSLLTVSLGGLKQGQNILLDNNASNAVDLAVGGNNQNTQYDGVLSGDGSFTKNGTGILTLTSNQTYLGATTISSGTLIATNLSGTSGINVTSGTLSLQGYNPAANLVVSNGASASVSGAGLSLASVSNNGSLNFTGNSGTITLASLSGATGTTTFSAGAAIPTLSEGVITIAGVATIGVANGGTVNLNGASASITTLNDAAVTLAATTVLTVSGGTQTTKSVTGSGSLVKIGSGVLTLNTPTNSGGIAINEGTVSTNAVPSGALTFNGGIWQFTGTAGTKDLNTGSSSNFKIDVTTGNLTVTRNGGNYNRAVMSGAGILTLANVGQQDGGDLQVDSGTVVLAGAPSIGQSFANVGSVLDVKPGATLKLGNANGGQIYYNSDFRMSGGTFDVNGQNPAAGQNTSVPAIDGTGTITNSALNLGTAVFKINGNKTFNGNITDGIGRVGVTLAVGAGTWTLPNANTFSGNTRINSGVLKLDNNLALQNSAFDTGGGGRMALTVTTPTFGGLAGGGSLATVINSGYGGVTDLTLNPGIGITNTYTGVIADGAAGMTLSKTGGGTQILSGSNTYTGLTSVTAGTLAFGASNVIASGPVIVSGATAILAMGTDYIDTVGTVTLDGGGSITGTGTSALTSTGTFEMKSGTVSASLGGSGIPLNKTTSGTVTLSGTNGTYDGLTTVSDGTLALGASNALGAGALIVSGATSVLDLGLDHTDSVGTVTLDGGTISGIGLSALTSTGTFEMKSGSVSASLAGTGIALNKTTNGTVILSGTNTYTGDTTVNAGILYFNGSTTSNAIVNAGTLVVNGTLSGSTEVNSGGTLAGSNGTLGNVTVESSGTLSPGGSGTGSLTVNGDIELQASSNFNVQFDTDAGFVDAITVNGNLTIVTGAVFNVNDIGSAPDGFLNFQNDIITYSGTWNGGTFDGLSDDSIFTSEGIAYLISYNDNDINGLGLHAVTLTIVPEPGAAVMLLGGLGLLLGMRRRRS